MRCRSNSSNKAANFTVKSKLTPKVRPNVNGKRIAILGGGLAGRLLAWRLVVRNKDLDNGITPTEIHVFEKGNLIPASHENNKAAAFTAAAMISPLSELVASELEIYRLGQVSLKLWPLWLDQLDCPQHFHQQGSLVIAHPNDQSELHQFQRDLGFKLQNEELQQQGNCYQALDNQQQVAESEPGIAKHFHQGLLLEGEAHLDSHQVLAKLVEQSQASGVQFHQQQARELNDAELESFDLIFDCRGLGSKNNNKQKLRGVRGEVVWLESKEIKLKRPIRLMHPRYKLYVVPKPNNQFIIGATEIESEDRSPISLRSSMELMSALYAINPAFAEARIISQESNLRPAYLDNLPQITLSTSKTDQPVISINGLYRHGYLIGPSLINNAIDFAKQKAFL